MIEDDAARTLIVASEAIGFQLYAPVAETFFCVEPTDHAPNHFAHGLSPRDMLAPGPTRRWRFSVDGLPDATS